VDLMLSEFEWEHKCYLVVILHPYAFWTDILLRHTGPKIHKAWLIYTRLIKHLEKHAALLKVKNKPWKRKLAGCITAAHVKLAKYYTKTEGPGGQVFNFACILDPARKLSLYQSSAFEPHYTAQYVKELRDYYETHYAHLDKRS
jgi:hypothetical protein